MDEAVPPMNPTKPPVDEGRRKRLLSKYLDETITESELREFLGLLDEDIEYAKWAKKDKEAQALRRLAAGVRAKLFLSSVSS